MKRPRLNFAVLGALLFLCFLCLSCQGHLRSDERELLGRLLQHEREDGWRILILSGGVHYLFDIRTKSRIPIYLAPPAGSDASSLGMASFNPDGTKITFTERRERNRRALVVFDLIERKSRTVLTLPHMEAARWSPTGEEIAFQGVADSTGTQKLYLYSLRNNSMTALVESGLQRGELLFTWGPEGKDIVYQDDDNHLWIFDLEKKTRTEVDKGWFPTCSPNGRYIAYQVDSSSETRYAVYDRVTQKKEFILGGRRAHRNLIWSPDSRYLVYSSLSLNSIGERLLAFLGEEHYGDLFVVDLQTKVCVRLGSDDTGNPSDWAKTK